MQVFISWSGQRALALAQKLHSWLPLVIQQVDPFLSSTINKGSRWSNEISLALESSEFGICCVTKDNYMAPWLLFEAGALSKSVSRDRLAPILFDLSDSDINKSPLSQFQCTSFKEKEIFLLLESMNESMGPRSLKRQQLLSSFERFWPDLEAEVRDILGDPVDVSLTGAGEADGEDGSREASGEVSDEGEVPKPRNLSTIFTDDIEEFVAYVDEFRGEATWKEDPDFWETHILERKEYFGIGGTSEDYLSLANENPNWVWPLIRLGNKAIQAGDYEAAYTFWERADAVVSNAPIPVDDLGALVAYERGGVAEALNFVRKKISSGLSEQRASNLFDEIVGFLKKGGETVAANNTFGILLREFSLSKNPAKKGVAFDIAYSSAYIPGYEKIAFSYYSDIMYIKDYEHALNNLGLLASRLNYKNIGQNLLYRSVETGNVLASSNLANRLIEGEFLDHAEKLLSNIEDVGDHGENIGDSKVKLAVAVRKRKADFEGLAAKSGKARRKFRRFCGVAYNAWLQEIVWPTSGSWISLNGNVELSIDMGLAKLTRKIGDKSYSSSLTDNLLCLEGNLSEVGASLISLGSSGKVLITRTNKPEEVLILALGDGGANSEYEELVLSAVADCDS